MSKRRAYLVYECEHGWVYEPARVTSIHEVPDRMRAFSRLSQLTWHLNKSVSETGKDDG